ncbi:fibronectin type III domain-containing protein [Candidatus Poriferisodalis sp.]|uniref:fibronectin type III domain-containing protein n=1 Tax=Candidatus Poriferisodalis sp. TaxID=3101277 RepID=UPI003B520F59
MRMVRLRRRIAVFGFLSVSAVLLVPASSAMAAPGAPDRPARPVLDSVSSNSVTISWADAGDSSVTGYAVLRRDRSEDALGVFHLIASGVSGTTYTDETVEPAGSYGYRVKARNANGLSRRSRNLRVDVPEAAVLETAVPDVAAQGEPLSALSVTNSTTVYINENTSLSHQIEALDTGATGTVTYDFEPLDYEGDGAGYNTDWDYLDASSGGLIVSYDRLDYEERPPPRSFALGIRITATSQGREVSIDQTIEIVVVDITEGAAQNFQVTGQSSTTIALDWDPPDGIDPNHYRVFVFESGDGPVDDRFEAEIATTASRRTVDRLQPDTTYEIYLFPVTDQGVKLDILSLTHSTDS